MTDLTTKQGALWVQPQGPNTKPVFLGGHGLDEIAQPQGNIELIRSFNPDKARFETIGRTVSPPDPVTCTVSTRLKGVRDWLEKLHCPFSLYALQHDCGRADEFSNHVRGTILERCHISNRSEGPVASIEADEVSGYTVDVEADPPTVPVPNLEVKRLDLDTLFVGDPLCVIPNTDPRCYSQCGGAIPAAEQILTVGESAAAPLFAGVNFSSDYGETFTDTVANPFDAGLGIFSGTRFPMGRNGYRWLIWQESDAAAQGYIAYCDDALGTTWTTVAIGGAVAGEGSFGTQGVFSLHSGFIFLAGMNGSIWKSVDAGLTWTQVEDGVIHAGDYNAVHFSDEYHGVAVGDNDIIAITSDGGETWEAATQTGVGDDLHCCWRHDRQRIWVGGGSTFYFSNDGGVTWTERLFYGPTNVNFTVLSMSWYDDHYGFIGVVDASGAPIALIFRTINGGYNWELLYTASLEVPVHIACVRPDLAYVANLDLVAGGGMVLVIKESA